MLGFTQEELGSLVGVSAVTLSRWENEVQTPAPFAVSLLEQFARAKDPPLVAFEARRRLQAHGPVVALYHLLKAVLEPAGEV